MCLGAGEVVIDGGEVEGRVASSIADIHGRPVLE
jgi:hypothetical protein